MQRNRVTFTVFGLIIRICEAHIPGPAFGEPNLSSGKVSRRNAAVISAASSRSSSPAASIISCNTQQPDPLCALRFDNTYTRYTITHHMQHAVGVASPRKHSYFEYNITDIGEQQSAYGNQARIFLKNLRRTVWHSLPFF